MWHCLNCLKVKVPPQDVVKAEPSQAPVWLKTCECFRGESHLLKAPSQLFSLTLLPSSLIHCVCEFNAPPPRLGKQRKCHATVAWRELAERWTSFERVRKNMTCWGELGGRRTSIRRWGGRNRSRRTWRLSQFYHVVPLTVASFLHFFTKQTIKMRRFLCVIQMFFGIYILSPQGVANFRIYSAGLRSVPFIREVVIRGKEWRHITGSKGIVSIVSIRIKNKRNAWQCEYRAKRFTTDPASPTLLPNIVPVCHDLRCKQNASEQKEKLSSGFK